jgi:hypothetical protein
VAKVYAGFEHVARTWSGSWEGRKMKVSFLSPSPSMCVLNTCVFFVYTACSPSLKGKEGLQTTHQKTKYVLSTQRNIPIVDIDIVD